MKKKQFLMSAFALALSCVAQASIGDIFTQNYCYYKILTENTVTFKGLETDVYFEELIIPSTVTYNGTIYQVTEIADSAFINNNDFESVEIEDGVTKIGKRVFQNCRNMEYAYIPPTVTSIGINLFYGCDGLSDVDLNCSITTLPASCFQGCKILQQIILPNTISSIGSNAFYGCIDLETVYMPDNLTKIPHHCFNDLPKLKNIIFSANSKLNTIDYAAFYNLPSLEILNLPNTVTTIINPTSNNSLAAIGSCKKLKEINIKNSRYKSFDGVVYSPDKTTLYFIPGGIETYTIDENTITIAGHACVGSVLTSINFSENLKTIGRYSFCNCENLKNLVFPVNLETIGESAFDICKNLGPLTFPEGCKLKTIQGWAFASGGVSGELVLPDGLEEIGFNAFSAEAAYTSQYGKYGEEVYATYATHYGNISKVVFPNSLKKIGHRAFSGCDMDSVILNDGLEYLGDETFTSCQNLKYAYVPETVRNWGGNGDSEAVFIYCQNLEKLDWYAPFIPSNMVASCYSLSSFTIPDNVEEIGSQAFRYCVSLRLIKIPNSVKTIGLKAFESCMLLTHVTLPSHLDGYKAGMIYNDDKIYEYTIPANITTVGIVGSYLQTNQAGWNYNRILNVFIMNDEIPDTLKRINVYTQNKMDTYGKTTFFVKPSVYHEKYPDGKWTGTYILDYRQPPRYAQTLIPVDFDHDVSYKIPVTMKNASGNPIEYKTLCRDFDVDLSHTNDDLPEGVQPLRAYVVEDVDGELRLVLLREIRYIPSRLKANATDENDNLYPGVDEYVGVVLRGTPGYTYYYEMGEHDYTQGAWGQWLMSDAMAYSDSRFEANLMAGDANDDFYVYQTVVDENDNEIVNYGLNNNRFKIYSKDGWLTYNKSYLQLPKNVSDAIERNKDSDSEDFADLTLVFDNADGTTDKVSAVEFIRNAESDIFYNPYGQRVRPDAKGIVISKGVKRFNR